MEQEQDAEQAKRTSAPKEQETGGGEQLLTREQQMEKTVVRDRADSLGRKGASKRPASSPPHPDKRAGGKK